MPLSAPASFPVDSVILEAARFHLCSSDPVMERLVVNNDDIIKRFNRTPEFRSLVKIIVSQQLSNKAAETIFWRLDNLMNSAISPKSILDCDDKNILRCGVSKAKVSYLNFLAIHFSENPSFIRSLIMMNEQEAYMELTALKGIGPWSAEIFLLFYLNKINVFPKGDATLLKAMRLLYGVTSDKKCEKVHKLVNSWSPYKGVAAIYLWNWVDNGMPALSTK